MIDARALDVLSDPSLANALRDGGPLGLQYSGLVVAIERGTRHVGERDLDALALGLEAVGNAAQGATRSDGGHETVDFAVCIRPDFRSRRFNMGTPVGSIVPLIGPDGAIRFGLGQGAGEPLGI